VANVRNTNISGVIPLHKKRLHHSEEVRDFEGTPRLDFFAVHQVAGSQ